MQSYEDYVRSVLGYSNNSIYDNFQDNYFTGNNMYSVDYNTYYKEDVEDLYPDIYKMIYPYVENVCRNRSGNLSNEFIDSLVDEVYANLEKDRVIVGAKDGKEDRQGRHNFSIQDLIRILILNGLWNRPRPPQGGPFPPRPPQGPRPPIPPQGPFPPRPPQGPRPPIQSRQNF